MTCEWFEFGTYIILGMIAGFVGCWLLVWFYVLPERWEP